MNIRVLLDKVEKFLEMWAKYDALPFDFIVVTGKRSLSFRRYIFPEMVRFFVDELQERFIDVKYDQNG
jgi:hypothetical protein